MNPRPRTRPGLHLKTEKLPYQRPVIGQLQFTTRAEEVAMIQVGPDEEEGPAGQYIKIRNADRLRLQLIAEVLAKATMLSFQERRAARDFDRTEPLAP